MRLATGCGESKRLTIRFSQFHRTCEAELRHLVTYLLLILYLEASLFHDFTDIVVRLIFVL
jgi:hypothetical protein